MSIFEALMLICFGISWPISIAKTLRTRITVGTSKLFLVIVIVGYACGIVHKVLYKPDWVLALYAINMALVATELVLCLRYNPHSKTAGT